MLSSKVPGKFIHISGFCDSHSSSVDQSLCLIDLGCDECNERENILVWQRFLKPYIRFGVSFEEMMSGEKAISQVCRIDSLIW